LSCASIDSVESPSDATEMLACRPSGTGAPTGRSALPPSASGLLTRTVGLCDRGDTMPDHLGDVGRFAASAPTAAVGMARSGGNAMLARGDTGAERPAVSGVAIRR